MIGRCTLASVLLAIATVAHAEPLKFYNGRLFITAEVNGVRTEALLDSGAEATILDPVLATEAKLPEGTAQVMKGSGGTAPARIVEGATVRAIGIELHPEAVVVMDLSDLSTRLIKRHTKAIVGRELFDAARLEIDIPRNRIRVAGKDRPPRGKMLALTPHAGIESIPVLANGRTAQAEFDLGNGSGVMVSRALAKRLKLTVVGKKAGGGIGGPLTRDVVVLNDLVVAGKHFRKVQASVDDLPNANDLNVGTSVLSRFLITTDFSAKAVWLAPK